MFNKDLFYADFYRFLWQFEVNYRNRYIDVLNNFNRFSIHTIEDYFNLYSAEADYKSALKLTKDIERFLRLY